MTTNGAEREPLPVFTWQRALTRSGLPSSARLVGFVLSTLTDPDLTIPALYTPSLSRLAKLTGLNEATVKRHLNVLEDGGWVRRDRPSISAARKNHDRTQYALLTPDLEDDLGAPCALPGRTVSPGLGAPSSEAGRTVRHNQHLVPSPSPAPTTTDVVAADPSVEELSKDEESAFMDFHSIRKFTGWKSKAIKGGYWYSAIDEFRRSRKHPLATSDRKLITNLSVAAELEREELEREQQRLGQTPHETQLLGA